LGVARPHGRSAAVKQIASTRADAGVFDRRRSVFETPPPLELPRVARATRRARIWLNRIKPGFLTESQRDRLEALLARWPHGWGDPPIADDGAIDQRAGC
jgi:hypothetical protein